MTKKLWIAVGAVVALTLPLETGPPGKLVLEPQS